MAELKRALTLTQKYKIKCKEFEKVPTSLLTFYRKKNKVDIFKKEFKDNQLYLETEEDLERVLYFYLSQDSSQPVKEAELKID